MSATLNCALIIISALLLIVVVNGQDKYTTPVPILKQINVHNDDGSYSYGYEAADRSFKIETKFANGEVHGKYGYVDDSGNLREIEYGASRRGFEPKGTDINVAPPTLKNSVNSNYDDNDDDDGQYREDPSIYYKDSRYNTVPRISTPIKQAAPINFNNNNFNQNYQKPSYNTNNNNNNYNNNYNQEPQQEYRQNYQPEYQQNNYQPTAYNNKQNYQTNYQPQYQQNNYQTPQRNNYQLDTNIFRGHPATNFDLNTGSYSLNYSG